MPYRTLLPQRRLEWWLASITFVWGVFLIMAPGALAVPPYILMRAWAPPEAWGCLAAIIGMFHWWALYINGRRPWSAHVRAAATAATALVFGAAFGAIVAAIWYGLTPLSVTVVLSLAPVSAAIVAFWVATQDCCVERKVAPDGS